MRPSVLVVTTQAEAASKLDATLARGDFAVWHAVGPREGLELVGRTCVELVVLAADRFDADSMALLRRLRADRHTCELPVVVVAQTLAPTDTIQALELGATECLPASIDGGELQARLRAAVRVHRRFDAFAERAGIDPCTGLGNGRAFEQRVDEELEVWDRYHRDVALVLIGIDGFAELEREFGRGRTDARLLAVAEMLRRCARSTDVLFHRARGCFAAVLRETPGAGAMVFADRVCERLRGIVATAADPLPAITGSIGVGATDRWRMTASDMRGRLLGEAGGALERAGTGGGDRCELGSLAVQIADVA